MTQIITKSSVGIYFFYTEVGFFFVQPDVNTQCSTRVSNINIVQDRLLSASIVQLLAEILYDIPI